jgi:hypothetical protein
MADPSEQKQASIINDAAISTFAELQEKIRKLTEKRPGRALTNEQRATLLAEAKIFRQKMIDDAAANKKHSTTGGVYLWCMRDPEAIHFANQIHDALAPSLLILSDASPVDSDGPNTGVKILLKRLDLKDDAIVELQVVLEKGGIKTEVLPDKILFEGQVVIWVASQPE